MTLSHQQAKVQCLNRRRVDSTSEEWFSEPAIASSLPAFRGGFGTLSLQSLFHLCLILLTLTAALAVTNMIDLNIRRRSGLWSEPAMEAKVSRLSENVKFYSIGFALLLPLTILFWLAASRRKRTILFLRRFGRDYVNNSLQLAVRKSLFRDFRLVTLDDTHFQPVTSRRLHIGATAGVFLAGAFALYVTFTVVDSYLAEGLRGWAQAQFLFQESVAELLLWPYFLPEIFSEMNLPGLSDLPDAWNGTFDILAMMPMAFCNQYLALLVLLEVGMIAFACGFIRLRVIARQQTTTLSSLDRVVRKIRTYGKWYRAPLLLGPQATVVAVDTQIWQDAVLNLSNASDAVLIDISECTENIVWEIRRMLEVHAGKCIFVANSQKLNQWFEPELAEKSEVARLLHGQTLVRYEGSESLDLDLLYATLSSVTSNAAPSPFADTTWLVAVPVAIVSVFLFCAVTVALLFS